MQLALRSKCVARVVALLASVSVCWSIAPPSSFDCANVKIDGAVFDLSSLNKDWTTEGRLPLRFNPCAPLKYHNDACPAGKSNMCALDSSDRNTGRANVGTLAQIYLNQQKQLVLMYSNGSYDMNGYPFVCLVRFECDEFGKEDRPPFEPATDGSKFFLIWRTKAGCAKSLSGVGDPSRASSFGLLSTLLILTLIGLAGYCVAGSIYRFIFRGARGADMMPHHEFWLDLADFIRELAGNIAARLCGRGGYQQI